LSQRRLAGVLLLGGAVRPTRFHKQIDRPPLAMPYASGRSLLDAWRDQVSSLAAQRQGTVPLRVMTDHSSAPDHAADAADPVPVQYDSDPSALRGTGGVLRDVSAAYDPDDLLLVANAAQFMLRPLSELVAQLESLRADVAVLAHQDGTPITLMLVRCGCLRSLPDVGFVDMKEQAIPLLAAAHDVRAVCVDQPVALGLRTAQSYLAGLRALHARSQSLNGDVWRSAFALTEEAIEPSVRIHDSVVLRGGGVGAGAVLVRSLICPGGRVAPKAVVVDKLVTSEGHWDAQEAP
jgi:hypothetical protein